MKFIKNQNKNTKEKLFEIFSLIQENSYSIPYKKIKGEQNLFRIRYGSFRIIFEISKEELKVYVIKIDKRSKVYRNI